MKIRQGFVSNSSSSSFVVINYADLDNVLIDNCKKSIQKNTGKLIIHQKDGESNFGWQFEIYKDFTSKVIFSYIQAKYMIEKNSKWMNMLETVLKDELNAIEIEWDIVVSGDNNPDKRMTAYIDHQSASNEGMNTEIFDSPKNLRYFLFGKNSYIQCGNDNTY
jgi:hypothetical protein